MRVLASSYLQHTAVEGMRYEKPDNITASMYVAMTALLAVKELPVVALSVKARR